MDSAFSPPLHAPLAHWQITLRALRPAKLLQYESWNGALGRLAEQRRYVTFLMLMDKGDFGGVGI